MEEDPAIECYPISVSKRVASQHTYPWPSHALLSFEWTTEIKRGICMLREESVIRRVIVTSCIKSQLGVISVVPMRKRNALFRVAKAWEAESHGRQVII